MQQRREERRRARADPAAHRVTIIGLGPVGRELAVQLTALGVARLRLIDAGRVSPRWQLLEGFDADDVGRLRAHVAAECCHRINPKLDVRTYRQRLSASKGSARPMVASRALVAECAQRLSASKGSAL